MNFVRVISSDIAGVAINNNNLIIKFIKGGIYEYINAACEYEGLLNSTSKGKFFNSYIKNRYEYKKIN